MKSPFFALFILLMPFGAMAQELRIGHLETADDIGINWLFYHCNQSGQVLNCSVFQTLIMHQLLPSKRNEEIQKWMKGDPVKNFVQYFADTCKNMAQIKSMILQSQRTGRGADGRPVDARQLDDYKKMMDAIDAACRDTNTETVRRFAELITDQEIATCTVFNDYSDETFNWNQATQAWVSQEGPIGPCGRITIGTLEHDPASKLSWWKYTLKKINTKPDGVLDNGVSCKQFPDSTLNYTWRATTNAPRCTYIKNGMN